jgi:hypothetical protein
MPASKHMIVIERRRKPVGFGPLEAWKSTLPRKGPSGRRRSGCGHGSPSPGQRSVAAPRRQAPRPRA